MAITVDLDVINGTTASHHIQNGWAITRQAVVRGLADHPSGTNTGKLLAEAEAALVAEVGDRGDPCPDIPVETYLEQFVPEVISPNEVRFRLIYKGYPRPTYELDTSLAQVESNLDASGNLIVLSYVYPSGYLLDPRKAGQYFEQGGMISRPIPEMSFTVKFIITGGTWGGIPLNATETATLFAQFTGKVNSEDYTIGVVVGTPRQWMVTRVRGVSKDGGVSYEMAMTFQYRKQTWDQLVVYINPDDGKPPPDLLEAGGSSSAPPGYKMVAVPEEDVLPSFVFGEN